MPFTVNGIGTRYLGRRHLAASVGRCEFCKRQTTLSNYDTTLWLVVFHLPLVPLAKKQVFSDCSACRKHRVMPLSEWRRLQDAAIERAQAAADAAPRSPEAAIDLIGTLMACFRHDQAADLARRMHEGFPASAAAQVAAGDALRMCRAPHEAERAYLTALELDHGNFQAKRAVAELLIDRHEPATALRVLMTAPRIEVSRDPALCSRVATALVDQGHEKEALPLLEALLAHDPALGRDSGFRRSMLVAERATGSASTALPRLSWFRRARWALTAAVIALMAGLPFAWSEYVAEHQTLHIVNGFEASLTVRWEDGSKMIVPARSRIMATVAEGPHAVVASAAGRQLQGGEFAIASTFSERFFHRPVFVLNPGRGATLLVEQAIYARGPRRAALLPPLPQHFVGHFFQTFPAVDYVFREFPAKIDAKDEVLVRTRIGLAAQAARQIVAAPSDVAAPVDRMRLAETHLRLTPGDAELRAAYKKACDDAGQSGRAKTFLAAIAAH